MADEKRYSAHQRRRICAEAPCDERTFDKWAADPTMVGETVRQRIERAIRELAVAT